ncbi:alpha/beta fold hydrolase [Saccharibacillus sp. CPCC 101409]|uniref:alpha/beta fold hydrolase n=1 Tax=Saccharibacillus sp. CPCC 101409 TaxID=3058041 RepID=UPI00267241DC|nr:alpha/beta fold hydrolase [Saccharibacillus sp. CPCC 101409]MDO3409043.1 alpha/beta fold hydrolase [Saccharibacillus sp. CPCC 101409]
MLTGSRPPIRPFESGGRGRKGYRRKERPRRGRPRVLTILIVLLIVAAAGAAVYVGTPYGPSAQANAALRGSEAVTVSQKEDWIEFEPAASGEQTLKQPGVIFYPGARVKPEAYGVLAKKLAQAGRHVVIVKMPFNFAVLGTDKAADVLKAYPDERFVIGGHSLGGPFAARYAAENPGSVDGIFFLASYAESKGDLSQSKLPALSITGSKDEILDRERYEKGRAYLPAGAVYEVIEGGSHAQFGSYGEQWSDGKASISAAEQAERTAALIVQWLDALPADTQSGGGE